MKHRFLVTAFFVAAGTVTFLFAVTFTQNPASDPTVAWAGLAVLGSLSIGLQLAVLRRQSKLTDKIQNQLAKLADAESRHDYHRKVQLEQLDMVLKRVRAVVEGVNGRLLTIDGSLQLPYDRASELPRVLFVTSNGAGMGHLTRCLAVARSGRQQFNSQFMSLSSSADVVRRFGYEVLQYPSHGQSPGMTQAEWNDRFAEYFDSVCRVNQPAAIVFDGTWIYRAVHETARRQGIKLIWLRRGLWMDGASAVQVRDRASIADQLLVPGDIAESADTGPVAVREGTVVPAPTLTTPEELLSRDDALRKLNLDPDRQYILVQLGAGTINDIAKLRNLVTDYILEYSASHVVVSLSPLGKPYADPRERVHVVREYPLAPFLNAFEFMVIAAGYNSVHESIRFARPAVVVPNLATTTDNQLLRANEFARLGFGIAATTETETCAAIERMLNAGERAAFSARMESAKFAVDSGEGAAAAVYEWLGKDD